MNEKCMYWSPLLFKTRSKVLYSRIENYLQVLGFKKILGESTLYLLRKEIMVFWLYILICVDDVLVTGNNLETIDEFKEEMKKVFEMTDLGEMSYFLWTQICQKKYIGEIVKNFKMEDYKPMNTPMNQKIKAH